MLTSVRRRGTAQKWQMDSTAAAAAVAAQRQAERMAQKTNVINYIDQLIAQKRARAPLAEAAAATEATIARQSNLYRSRSIEIIVYVLASSSAWLLRWLLAGPLWRPQRLPQRLQRRRRRTRVAPLVFTRFGRSGKQAYHLQSSQLGWL